MRFSNAIVMATLAMGSVAHADVAKVNSVTLEKGCSQTRETFTLSLQGIQSNFIGPEDYFGGNNGLPIINQSTPTIMTVNARSNSDHATLSIEPFSFTLLQNGFMISENVLPSDVSPKSAEWVDFNAGTGVVGHVFRDGSIRFTGPDNAPLLAGTYSVVASKVSYSTDNFPSKAKGFDEFDHVLVRRENFPISAGQSNLGGIDGFLNNNTDYAEYYGLAFRNGRIYTATTDNSFDPTTTPIGVFNKLNRHGEHIIPQVNIVPPGFANQPYPTDPNRQLTEPTLSINPVNPQQLAATLWTGHLPEVTLPGCFLFVSNNGGETWNVVDVFADLISTLPGLPGFLGPLAGSNQQCIFDNFGNLYYTVLTPFLSEIDFTTITLGEYTVMSGDGGLTWQLIDFLTPTSVNPNSFGLDFPFLGTGVGPDGSAVTWLTIKQDVNFDEINRYGATLPLIAAAYKTTGLGQYVGSTHQEISGSEPGGYGNVAVGPKGEVLVVGTVVNNRLGSTPFTNTSLFFSFNKNGFNGTFKTAKIFANSNAGYLTNYLPQIHRNTFSHPQGAIDSHGRWYVTYVDQPSPHVLQPNPNIYLIYSDDHGKHWSSPLRINNDVFNTTFHFLPQLVVDPITDDLAITWLDTREDQSDTRTRLWGTVIKHGTLPRLH